jgi:hypothetical protein
MPATCEHWFCVYSAGFLFTFPTVDDVRVNAKVGGGFRDSLGFSECNGFKFEFGCVGFVFAHVRFHSVSELVVHKILVVSNLSFGAGEEIRTLDIHLGKVALYQLSYSRILSCF